MILELVDILIHPGKQAEFDKAIEHGIQEPVSYTHLDVYKRQGL